MISDRMGLTSRWNVDADFSRVRDAILNGTSAEEWVPVCPTVLHPKLRVDGNDLRGLKVVGGVLGETDLGSSLLDYASFSNVSFERTWLHWCGLTGASFVHSSWNGVQAMPIFGEETSFVECKLSKSELHESDLNRVLFESCALVELDFHSSKLFGLVFKQSVVKDSSFYRCALDCAYMASSIFDLCSFRMASLVSADLNGVTFESCDLSGADLQGVDFKSTKFIGGTFGIVEHAGVVYRTKISDRPQNRRAVEISGASRIDEIEWCVDPDEGARVPRVEGGNVCTKDGYWSTPAARNSRRYFKAGELMPIMASDYGLTLWQWDSLQGQ